MVCGIDEMALIAGRHTDGEVGEGKAGEKKYIGQCGSGGGRIECGRYCRQD